MKKKGIWIELLRYLFLIFFIAMLGLGLYLVRGLVG